MCRRIINLSCYNVGTSTHLHNLSDDEGMALRLGRKAQKVPNVAARVSVSEWWTRFHRTISASCKETTKRNGNFASKCFVFALNFWRSKSTGLRSINVPRNWRDSQVLNDRPRDEKLHDVLVRLMQIYFTCHQLVFDHRTILYCYVIGKTAATSTVSAPPPTSGTMKRTDASQVGEACCKCWVDRCYWWFLRSYRPQMSTTTAGVFVRKSPFRRKQSAYANAIHKVVTAPFSWSLRRCVCRSSTSVLIAIESNVTFRWTCSVPRATGRSALNASRSLCFTPN